MRYLCLFLLLVTSLSFAGKGSGKVNIEHVGNWQNKDLLFFYTTVTDDKPSCNTNNGRWVIDLTTELGKMQYSLILASQISGTEVRIGGANNCSVYPGSESVYWVGFP